ncbi:hypothetical protein [Phaeobacter inhibens]|uniref:hypothetical protein n=1 Tax=Phaeobacter inhibens TaxID=221822 RepID=UPI0021A414B8|nr:hypothetical protein [Phaeobacter inhibens]UWR71347.1 hypothetical protein K4L00_11705 [Phaeobacter inhibens]
MNDKIVVFKENARSAIFSNPSQQSFDKAQVDDCLIKENSGKCDGYLRDGNRIWLVELKGKDVEKAVKQIVATSQKINDHIGDREIIPVIVATKCPAIAGQQKQLKGLSKIVGKRSENLILRTRVAKISV